MRILLFQIRNADDPMLGQEERCFSSKLESLRDRIPFVLETHNIISNSDDYAQTWQDYDLIVVGGSGDYGCVNNKSDWFHYFCDVLSQIVESDKPLFCSCFGHQALAVALGGEVSTDRSRAELGTKEVTLNDAGQDDPLLGALPATFLAQFGHNDFVSRLPEGATNLASTPMCAVQAYKLSNRLVYATQFHPELSHLENKERATRYLAVYAPELTSTGVLEEMFRASEGASELLPRFVEMAVEHNQARAV